MKKATSLNRRHLTELADRIACPPYDNEAFQAGILHIGVGGFHRAHQAYYLHQLHEQGNAAEWGICGVGIREGDRKISKVLAEQDCLYTLIIRHPDGRVESSVIGSMVDFLLGVDDPGQVITRMAAPTTKIVSLTITEGGYNFKASTGAFDFDNPDIQHDLAHPESPKTVYGFLTAGLRRRREAGLPAFTILSCDNIQHNGSVARAMLLSFCRKQDVKLAAWIEQEVCFPNTMVDRITPVTTPADIDYLQDTYQLKDAWPVSCEPFLQWIVEDKFSNGRPAFEKVGVQFVSDVKPYEEMKLRLLNAGHSVLGILGAIHGHKTIFECMQDEVFASYLRRFLDVEASPVLDEVEGIDLTSYKDSLEERFANPNIKDKVSRICSESSAKLPKFLIPTIQENLAQRGSIQYASLVLAAWCYYSDKGISKDQQPIEIIDAQQTALHQAAQQTQTDPLAFIRQTSIFGDLLQHERFKKLYTELVQKIYSNPDVRRHMQDML